MGRKNKTHSDQLTLEDAGNGLYRLFGYVGGEQIRKRGRDLAALEKIKNDLEAGALADRASSTDRRLLPASWITPGQLRDAEAAFQLIRHTKLTLLECAQLGVKTLGDAAPVTWEIAVAQYEAHLIQRETSQRHQDNVMNRLSQFKRATTPAEGGGFEMIGEVTSQMIRNYCLRSGVAGYTKIGDAAVIRAFLTYCVEFGKWIRFSPFDLDMDEMKQKADKGRARPRLLLAKHAEDLLTAAIAHDGGNHVPYLLLCLWGGIRRAEVEKLTSDDIRFEDGHAFVDIQPEVSKTASYREVKLPDNIVPLLQDCIERKILTKEPIGEPLEAGWADIREKAGLIKVTRKAPWFNRNIEQIAWQDNIMRHTGLSYYYRKTEDIIETARQGGHDSAVAFEHYINLGKRQEGEKFYAIRASLTPKEAPAKVA